MTEQHTASTLTELLRERTQRRPEFRVFTFLQDGEDDEIHMTYADLSARAEKTAALLRARGLAPGDRALLLYPPGLDYISAFFGCLYAGVIAVPVYPPDPSRLDRMLPRLQSIISDSQPGAALTDSMVLSMVSYLQEETNILPDLIWIATDVDETLEAGPPAAVTAGDVAFLQYTSGSTAAPRGVQLSHANLLHNLGHICGCFGLTSADRGVIWLPPYHDMGLIGGILQAIYADGNVVLLSPLDFLRRPLRWLRAISRYRATTSGGPNFAYDLCVRKIGPEERATLDLSSWTVAFNGAEIVRAETMERFAHTFADCGFRPEAFYPCYGLAEATLLVTGGKKDRAPTALAVRSGALEQNRVELVPTQGLSSTQGESAAVLVGCGTSLSDQTVVIVDPQRNQLCAPDEIGEIWISGPSVAPGYWARPEATLSRFRALLDEGQAGSGDPYLRTGDLGFMHDGELYITGRLKDLIILRGRNIYPQDIERSVEDSHPALRPGCAAAFSVPIPGGEGLVVMQEVRRGTQEADLRSVAAAMRRRVSVDHGLAVHAVQLLAPGGVPKTPSGKVQRYLCREGFVDDSLDALFTDRLQAAAPAVAAPAAGATTNGFLRRALGSMADGSSRRQLLVEFLREQIAAALERPVDSINATAPLRTLGVDSLAGVDLQFGIEANLGVELMLHELPSEITLEQLADELLQHMAAAEEKADPPPVQP